MIVWLFCPRWNSTVRRSTCTHVCAGFGLLGAWSFSSRQTIFMSLYMNISILYLSLAIIFFALFCGWNVLVIRFWTFAVFDLWLPLIVSFEIFAHLTINVIMEVTVDFTSHEMHCIGITIYFTILDGKLFKNANLFIDAGGIRNAKQMTADI